MVALSVLLPLLCPDADVPALLAALPDLHIVSDADLLFTPIQLPPELEAVRPKIQTFLAAEGRPGDVLYEEAIKEERIISASTGNNALDSKLLEGGFKAGEIAELVGTEGAGKTFIALETVLRYLTLLPEAYALWLDTTGTFSAERALGVLVGVQASLTLEDMPSGLPVLDRLIVAKAFDLQNAIQVIQSIKATGFPVDGGEPVEDKEDKANDAPQDEGPAMQVDAEAAQPDAEAARAVKDDKPVAPTHLSFIVIDSITAIVRPILSAKSPEGHARMVSFMRMLRSMATGPQPLVVLLTNLTTTASAQAIPQRGISAFETLQKVRPALGPTFSYLCDWTIWIGGLQEAFPMEQETAEGGAKTKIVEVWRSRRAPSNKWIVAKSDGTTWL